MAMLLFSALGVALLVGAAWALGFRSEPLLDRDGAIAEAEGWLPGFRACDVALADDGRGALVRASDGGLAIILPMGDGWVVRRVAAGMAAPGPDGVLRYALNEPGLSEARLLLRLPPPWAVAG